MDEVKKRFSEELAKTGKRAIDIAAAVSVYKNTAINWLNGKTMPQAELFFKLVYEYDLDVDYIIRGVRQCTTTQSKK